MNLRITAHKIIVIGTLSFLNMTAQADTLSVAVAANVQYVFDNLRAEFKKESGHDLQAVFNSSGKFVSQISNGAPFDVFISADMEYPMALYQQGLTSASPKIYAYGALVLWTMKNQDLTQWQSLLQSSQINKIAVANPKTAPYGRETIKLLKHFQIEPQLSDRMVFGESISQTNQYIFSGVVDIGFTAKSVVMSEEMKGKGRWIEMPANAYAPIAQGVVILKYGQQRVPQLAKQFYDFLSSPKAKAILQNNGYGVP